ncbi:heterokaryon incompatibility protein-domain-containing protein [Rhexocercosporidium sp. MPI-PUGE-AT-0058]|nr:heterokaryon incompatibility protein-domain-containing protein [Rhexocercosporidium sp. MPI-PUGE-AT-0058]
MNTVNLNGLQRPTDIFHQKLLSMAQESRTPLVDLSSKLCGPCHNVRTRMFGPKKPVEGPEPGNYFRLHDSYEELSKCLSCPLCQFLRRELLYIKEKDGTYLWCNPASIPAAEVILAEVSWASVLFSRRESYADLIIEAGRKRSLRYDNPVVSMQKSNIQNMYHDEPRGEPLKKMRSWIDSCIGGHPSCLKDSEQFRPSRLLDLAGTVGGDDIRLILSEHEIPKQRPRQSHYVTLSYCWGPPGLNATTTKENIEERRRKISFESLPKTVQDAVKVTRELGIRYLWVDALCIIQEDKDDWERESAVMGQIYRKSLCTLAAAIGKDCNGGLFAVREAAQLPASRLLFAEGGQSDRGLFLKPSVDHWYSSVELSTLSTRGWVMQERILAARTIFFTEEGIFWQCAERSSSEFKEGVSTNWEYKSSHEPASPESAKPSKLGFNELAKSWRADAQEYKFKSTGTVTTDKLSVLSAMFKGKKSRKVEARPWHNLIYEFTQRDLTQPNDRLRAVEGIADEFADSTNSIYVHNAGIWKSDMIGGMAWYRQWNQDSKQLSIAPSWSWACVSGQIVSMYKRTEHVVNIAEVDWVNTTTKSLSQRSISIQELCISGNVCRIRLYKRFEGCIFWAVEASMNDPPPPPQPKKFLGVWDMEIKWDELSGVKSAVPIGGRLQVGGWSPKILTNHFEIIFDASTKNPPLGTEFLCMPIVGVGFQNPSPQTFHAGLILDPIDPARKVYRRIGWCFMWASVPDDRLRKVDLVIV